MVDHGRRETLKFLRNLIVTGGALSVLPPGLASAQAGEYDVSYLWTPDREDALEYMEEIGRCLGPDVRRELRLVQGASGHVGILYDRDGDQASTRGVAGRHSEILGSCDLDDAIAIEDSRYEELHNVSYGVGPNLSVQKDNFRTIARILGEGVAKDLVIEETLDGNFALVYKRYGDRESTIQAAKRHSQLLNGTGISAADILERNNDVIFNNQGRLYDNDENDRKRNPVIPPKPKPIPVTPKRDRTPSTDDSKLEAIVDTYVKSRKSAGHISSSCTTAWSVYDLSSGEKLVSINEDTPLQCASMVKPFVAVAFFHEVERGRFTYGSNSQKHMRKSLVSSDNDSTTWLMNQIGSPAKIQRILDANYGDIFQQTSIVETIPHSGQTYRNKASAHDYSRFLYALYYNKLPQSSEIRRLMAAGGKRIINRAPAVPKDQGIVCYNKTGTTGLLVGDMGIIVPRDENGVKRPYTMIGIVQRGRKSGSLSTWTTNAGNTVGGVSSKVYRHMNAKYDLRE